MAILHESDRRTDTRPKLASFRRTRVDVNALVTYLSRRMRLYAGKVATIASEIVKELTSANDIEADAPREVQLDVEAVLNSYLRLDKEASDRAKDIMDSRGSGTGDFARLKRLAAEQKGIKTGDDVLDYLLDQLVEMLMHSNNVAEVFAEDVELRRKMRPILKRHMAVDDELEREVRSKMKHVTEGTRTWEVEYARIMEEIRRRKGL